MSTTVHTIVELPAKKIGNPNKGATQAYLATEHYNEGWNDCVDALVAASETRDVGELTDEQISDMIENADGMRCVDGEYRIEGRYLMNLARTLTTRASEAAPAQKDSTTAIAVELSGVAETLDAGGTGMWRTCSGCYESEDGYPVGHYPYSNILKCDLGGGCSDCGGIGAVWDTTDYEAMGRDFEASLHTEAAPVAVGDAETLATDLYRAAHYGTLGEFHKLVRASLASQAAPQAITVVALEPTHVRAINDAIEVMTENARVLHECHTDEEGSWGSDADAWSAYARETRIIEDLSDILASQAAPVAVGDATVAYLNDMGTEQKLSFSPIDGAFEHRALVFALASQAAPTAQQPDWRAETAVIISRERDHPPFWSGDPAGTFICPICGKDTPHNHTGEEIARHRIEHAPNAAKGDQS